MKTTPSNCHGAFPEKIERRLGGIETRVAYRVGGTLGVPVDMSAVPQKEGSKRRENGK
jgi:hypothetical protein